MNLLDKFLNGLRCIEKGFTGGKVLCGLLNLAPPPTNISVCKDVLGESVKFVAEKSMKCTAPEAVEINENISDIPDAFDSKKETQIQKCIRYINKR